VLILITYLSSKVLDFLDSKRPSLPKVVGKES